MESKSSVLKYSYFDGVFSYNFVKYVFEDNFFGENEIINIFFKMANQVIIFKLVHDYSRILFFITLLKH